MREKAKGIIDTLHVSTEEKEIAKKRVHRMLTQPNDGEEILQEATQIAYRVQKGKNVIDTMGITHLRFQEMYDLLRLQYYLLGLYDTFFKNHSDALHERWRGILIPILE